MSPRSGEQITEVQVFPIKPRDGLIGFASVVFGNQLYLGSIGIHTRLDGSGYRLTYPTKKVGERNIDTYHPISQQASDAIAKAVFGKLREMYTTNEPTREVCDE